MLEQSAPARISCRLRAVASVFVEIRTTGRAKSLAIIFALNIRGCGQQPRLSYGRAKVEISFVRVVQKNVRIVGFVGPRLGKKEVYLLIDVHVDFFETKPARQGQATFDSTTKVESSLTGR